MLWCIMTTTNQIEYRCFSVMFQPEFFDTKSRITHGMFAMAFHTPINTIASLCQAKWSVKLQERRSRKEHKNEVKQKKSKTKLCVKTAAPLQFININMK